MSSITKLPESIIITIINFYKFNNPLNNGDLNPEPAIRFYVKNTRLLKKRSILNFVIKAQYSQVSSFFWVLSFHTFVMTYIKTDLLLFIILKKFIFIKNSFIHDIMKRDKDDEITSTSLTIKTRLN